LDKASYPQASLKKKIYVIDEVHMLSKGAFNALLKTIEEPRNNVCFILATTELHKVPETIISRCQVFNFKKVSSPEMKKMLKWICQQENLSHTDDALEVIAKISEGCVRDAVKYVDQVSVLGDINEEHITKFLGVAPEGMIEEFLQMIKDSNKENIFTKIDEIHDQGVDLHNFAKQILMYMDQHFLENIDFFAQVSEAFTEIIGNIRYYPYPTIVYKIAINKHLNGVQSAECRVQNAEKKTPVVNPPSSIPAPGSQSSIPQSPQKSSEDNLQISITIPQSPQKDSTDHSSILSMLLEKMQHNTLRDNLQDQIAIEEVTENKVKIIAINKIAEMMLKKPENITIVQKSLSEILGREVMIEVKFENKENYFARKLG
jgi:DNA polymerase-3 subunit gamma/tau